MGLYPTRRTFTPGSAGSAPTKGTVVEQPARNGPTKTIRIVRRMTARLDPVLVNALNAAASFAAN
ncbi:hypothetical protein ACEV9S_24945, partial [Vibrio parahaemolyticus]